MSIYVRTFPIMNNNSTKLFKVKHFAEIFSGKYVKGAIAFFQLSVISYQLSVISRNIGCLVNIVILI
ncbi:MAG: hypothetical protein F6K40_18515 [Okeania sp. SIO3I5]|uniref:hypothetical protein n=1 Tax=Okeania sp. SIO3I5 TaxID=2607805 RepID=UPI0013B8BD42|nr:hypothetical protein [Okeania sp. SIO3I5]NEQ38148.1 hypothetical protein [Okeania sp. SIO3I5]